MIARNALRFLAAAALAAATVLVGCSSNNGGSGGAGQGGMAGQGSGGEAGASASNGGSGHGGGALGGASGSGGVSTGGASTGGIAGSAGQTSGGSAGAGSNATGGTGGSGGSAFGGQGGTSTGGGAGGVFTGGASGKGGTTGSGGEGSGGTAATGGTKSTGGTSGGGESGGSSGTGGGTGSAHWVGTWTASPYVDSQNPPPASLSNSVLRQVAHVSLGGSQIRVQFSNLSGNGPVTIRSAHVAICKASPAVDSTIDTATDKALSFSGTASVTIAQGKEAWSDPIDFTVAPLGNVSITTAFGSVPSSVVGHSGSRTTSYLQPSSSNVSAASMPSAQTTDHWFYISGIDVMADASAKGIVAIGDSITDGRGTDTNKNNRWTDDLAVRLRANASTANVAIMNQGIGATQLSGTASTSAQSRFSRDVLGQSGVKYVVVFDGVNDLGGANLPFATLKAAYDNLIGAAHAKGLLIYGATITPFGGNTGANGYYSAAHESVRQQVNTYIKSGVFDGYIDFDAAVTDGGDPPKLKAAYAAWSQTDGLHPGPAGYQKMADSVDLTLFTK
jgi:lysophospholipase L1-like esterase